MLAMVGFWSNCWGSIALSHRQATGAFRRRCRWPVRWHPHRRLTAGGLDLLAQSPSTTGPERSERRSRDQAADAKVRIPRPGVAGRPADAVPTTLTARLSLADNTLGLSDLSGKVADPPSVAN
jgi:hypothetical protein